MYISVSRTRSDAISIKASDPNDIHSSIDEARMIMRARHNLRPSEPDDFGFMTTQELLDLYQKITTGVYSALVGLVAISLVIGGIVVKIGSASCRERALPKYDGVGL